VASVSGQINAKVDKVDGKGLATNDYTSTEKQNLLELQLVQTKQICLAVLLKLALQLSRISIVVLYGMTV
jgi:hypothetical protein